MRFACIPVAFRYDARMDITPTERQEIAEKAGINQHYLYQCLSGRRDMGALEATRVEKESGGRVRRWHLRQSDWDLVWPELVGSKGAPKVASRKAA